VVSWRWPRRNAVGEHPRPKCTLPVQPLRGYDRDMFRAALVMCMAAQVAGCALFASGNRAHTSGGIAGCMADGSPAGTDLILSAVGTAALVLTGVAKDSPGWLAVPGVFLASGVIGSITAYRCRHEGDAHGHAVQAKLPPPSAGDTPTATQPDSSSSHHEPLRLPTTYEPPPPPTPPSGPPTCDTNTTACPEHMSCVLDGSQTGHCVLDQL
jgi:hypothetical protein